jgi:hypothetical protein
MSHKHHNPATPKSFRPNAGGTPRGVLQLFNRRPLLRSRVMSTSIPPEVLTLLSGNDFSGAADALAIANLPFGEVFRLISNCVPAMRADLHRRSSILGGSPASQQIICHLYLLVALLSLSSMKLERDNQAQTDSNSPYLRETLRIKEFLAVHKAQLNHRVVMRLIDESGEAALFTREALVAFQDYQGLVDHLLASGAYPEAANYVLNLPLLHQRQVLRLVQTRVPARLPEFLAERTKMTMEALFGTFAELALTSPSLPPAMRDNANEHFGECFAERQFTQPAHLHLYLIFMALLNQTANLERFLESSEFPLIDADFIAAFLASRGMFALVADVYARVPNRHVLAVRYAMRDSFTKTISLLQTGLRTAVDVRECWLFGLRECGDPGHRPPGCDWPRLITEAHNSHHVTLDDIFPLVPPEMELDSLHVIIAQAVQTSSNEMKQSNETRKKIEERAEQQRSIANSESIRPISVDPGSAVCFICGQSACDSAFEAFPCNHTVHTACYLATHPRVSENGIDELEESCPACGIASLGILDILFVHPGFDSRESEIWEVRD